MKLLVFLFSSALVLGIASSLNCNGRPDGSLAPDTEHCNYYYYCLGGLPVRMNCAVGLHYNAVRQICENPSKAGCVKCPTTGFRNLPVEGSCHNFIQCFKGIASDRTCPDGLNFDANYGQCSLEKNVKCY